MNLICLQIFDISWDLYQPNKLVSCGVKHIKVLEGSCFIIVMYTYSAAKYKPRYLQLRVVLGF